MQKCVRGLGSGGTMSIITSQLRNSVTRLSLRIVFEDLR